MENKGIYQIINIINNKIYIGSASSVGGFRKRWNEHRSNLIRNKHHNKHLQHAWNKYGANAFIFEKLEIITNDNIILEREQFYLDTLLPEYNTCKIAGNTLGIKLSEEHKKQISDRAKLRIGDKNPFYGKKHTDETKKLILETRKGKTLKPTKPIKQLSLNGDFIKEWLGTYYAANALGLNQSGINSALNGKLKQSGGYKWIYF